MSLFYTVIHVRMKKRDTAVIKVSLSLNSTYSIIQEFNLFVLLLFNCFLILGKVRLHNEQALHVECSAGYMYIILL